MKQRKVNKRRQQIKGFNRRLIGLFAVVAAFVALAVTSNAINLFEMAGVGISDGLETILNGASFAAVPLVITMKGVSGIQDGTVFEVTKGFEGFKELKGISNEAFLKMSAGEISNLYSEYIDLTVKAMEEHQNKTDEESKKALEALKSELNTTLNTAVKANQDILKEMSRDFTAMVEQAKSESKRGESFESRLKSIFDDKAEEIKEGLTAKRASVNMIVEKATATYGDITSGSDFAQMRPGVTDQPVRMPRLRSLFSTIPLTTEVYKYADQETVVRDAQNVAVCAPVTSTTKETLQIRQMTTKAVKDTMDFCRHFVEDYPFMQSRINKLINESVTLQVDDQILNGDGTGENLYGITYYASEFDATNVVLPLNDGVNGTIQAATFVDLLLGMARQIQLLGKQGSFVPNYALVNLADWFRLVESRKDLNNNYIDARVSVINGIPYVGGMAVLPLYNVTINTCYVFDSRKAEILDRMQLAIEIAFQNGTNWESDIATIKGVERVNLWCSNNNKNAFMKCSDVATAITAITAP